MCELVMMDAHLFCTWCEYTIFLIASILWCTQPWTCCIWNHFLQFWIWLLVFSSMWIWNVYDFGQNIFIMKPIKLNQHVFIFQQWIKSTSKCYTRICFLLSYEFQVNVMIVWNGNLCRKWLLVGGDTWMLKIPINFHYSRFDTSHKWGWHHKSAFLTIQELNQFRTLSKNQAKQNLILWKWKSLFFGCCFVKCFLFFFSGI